MTYRKYYFSKYNVLPYECILSQIMYPIWSIAVSGAGTNLKVGGGHRSGAKCLKKIFLVVPLYFFWRKKHN